MKYIELLNNDDIRFICNAISGKIFKKMFADSPKEFSKIKPGFRPNSLTDVEAVELAIKNLNKEFIRGFIDVMLKKWIAEIERNIEEVRMTGVEYDDAVAITLLGSYFMENVKLYFKLAQEEKDDDYIFDICNKMVIVAQNKENRKVVEDENSKNQKNLLPEIQELTLKIEALEKQKTDTEKQLEDLEQKNKDVNTQLSECRKQLEELRNEHQQNMLELVDLRERAKHEIIVDEENIKSDEYDIISLCEVLPPDYNGIVLIERYADLTEYGEFEEFYCDEVEPTLFENRDKLYLNEGPRDAGIMGVWMWRAVPNNNNPNKDYIYSRFASEIKPIEMLSIHQVSDEKGLLDMLKDGIDIENIPEIGMYSAHVGKGRYTGFLCSACDFEKTGEKYRIKSSIITLNKYEFGRTEFIKLDNNRRFFKKLSVGIPDAVVPIKDAMELIKNIIINRNSWSSFKEAGKTRGEWKLIKKFLEELEVGSITCEIAETLNCLQSNAVDKLNEFVSVAASYIDGNSIEDSVVEAVIVSDENLLSRCKNLLRDEWEEENRTAILDKQSELKSLGLELTKSKEQLASVNSERERYETEILQFKAELDSKEQLAADVEQAIENRIKTAQTNAANFIAEMAFVNAPARLVERTYCEHEQTSEEVCATDLDFYIMSELKEEIDEDWEMTLNSIEDELIEAGVMGTFARPMAAYLYSSYLIGGNLLLVGPNAEAIAQAFSCAVTGKLARKIYYKQSTGINLYRNQVSKGDVIIIEEPFNAEWVSQIPYYISNAEGFYIGVHPFIEDLQIEPKSYFNYMLPLFTDCVVDKTPVKVFMCSHKAQNYLEYEFDYSKKDNSKVLSTLHVPALTKNRMQLIVGNMHLMLGDSNTDYDVLFALLPYAYATMQMHSLYEMIRDSSKKKISISNKMTKYLVEIYGEFDE